MDRRLFSLQFSIASLFVPIFLAAQCPTKADLESGTGGTFSGNCVLNVGTSVTMAGDIIWQSGTLDIQGNGANVSIGNGANLDIVAGSIITTNAVSGRVDILGGGQVVVEQGASLTTKLGIRVIGNILIEGTVASTNSMIDVDLGGVVTITSTGVLTTGGAGDNDIAGQLISSGTITTNGDINVTGNNTDPNEGRVLILAGTLTIGMNLPDGEDSDLIVSNNGYFYIQSGASVTVEDDVQNMQGTPTPPIAQPGSFLIEGTINIGDNLRIYNSEPVDSFFAGGANGVVNIAAGGNFQDQECPYPQGNGTFDYCACNGLNGPLHCAAASPVVLTEFTAVQQQNAIRLDWATSSEIENHFFTIERLQHDDSFIEIARVNGHGTTQLEHHYSVVDPRPVSGKNYYRLKQTDFGGPVTYFAIVKADFTPRELSISVFPNPAQHRCTIAFSNLAPFERRSSLIRNAQGVTVAVLEGEGDEVGSLSLEVSLDSYAEGIYLITSEKLLLKLIVSGR